MVHVQDHMKNVLLKSLVQSLTKLFVLMVVVKILNLNVRIQYYVRLTNQLFALDLTLSVPNHLMIVLKHKKLVLGMKFYVKMVNVPMIVLHIKNAQIKV